MTPIETDYLVIGAGAIGMAFVDYLQAKNIAIGRDMRDTSPDLAKAFIEGARSRLGAFASGHSRRMPSSPRADNLSPAGQTRGGSRRA